MKKSKYNYIVKNKYNVLIFNALKSTCVVLDKKEYQDFIKINKSSPNYQTFCDLGMYTPKDYKETDEVCFLSRVLAQKERRQFYRIYTTLNCNAKCPYCYEASVAKFPMSMETAKKVCDFIKDRMIPNTAVIIEWFGGEPMLNEKVIDYITDTIKLECEKNGSDFYSYMISNGYLFDKEKATKAKEKWNLKNVQITLDGLKETYERIKGFDKKDSFEKVIENIKTLTDCGVRVNIRLNYDKHNFKEILSLIEYLGKEFSANPSIHVYAKKIMHDKTNNSMNDSAKTDIIILEKLISCGLVKLEKLIDSIPRRDNTCVAHILSAFMILPNGDLGKCSQAAAKDDIVGNAITGAIDDRKLVRWCSPRLENKCLKCKLLPLCNGGCLYEKFLNKDFCFANQDFLKYKLKRYLDYTTKN